ncbi:MAG: hypothetical protein ABEI77_04730 [Halorientalis sp.]
MSKAASHGSEAEGVPSNEASGGDRESVSTDDAFQLLSNKRRRYALHYLKRTDETVELGDLSERIAAWENETSVQAVDAAQRKRVYTSLQSHHLPKMADQGVISYDERAGEVQLTDHGDELDVYLEVVDGRDIPWSQYYLALSAVNGALLVAVAVDAWPLTALPDIAWAAFIVTTGLCSALGHVYHDYVMQLGRRDKPPELRDS